VAHRVLFSAPVKQSRELLAAGLGGVVASMVDVVTLVILVRHTSASIPLAAFLAAGAGAVVCFVLNKFVAFRDRSPVTVEQVLRFGLVSLATGLLTAGAMKVVAVDLQVPVVAAKAICAAAVFVVWTFPAQRRFVFKRQLI
jgi:putative flippase GtrA